MISRNNSIDEHEWTCVHDIREIVGSQFIEPVNLNSEEANSALGTLHTSSSANRLQEQDVLNDNITLIENPQITGQFSTNNAGPVNMRFNNYLNAESSRPRLLNNFWQPLENNHVRCSTNKYQVPSGYKIHKNKDRLTHYIQETRTSMYFTKEPSYSNDGRLICSPFGPGVRLLSLSPNCDELSYFTPKLPAVRLYELGMNTSHLSYVTCTKFSPVHPLLVSSCVAGRIVWYQPRF